MCKISELGIFSNGEKVKNKNGTIPVYGGNGVMGYTDAFNFDKDTIIIGRVGANCGAVNISSHRCWISDNAIAFNVKEDHNQYYIYLLLEQLDLNKYHIGSSQPLLTQGIIGNININIFNKPVQNKIVELIKNIDDKTKNNNKINSELESMAKTIYDYWFLQFEFPNEEGKPYKSSGGKMVWNKELGRDIPEGWEVKKLGDIFDFVKGKIPDKIDEKKKLNFAQYLTIDAVNGGVSGYCSKDSMVLTNGEVLMVMDGAASSEVYVGNKGIVGSTFCKLDIKDKNIDNNFLFIIMKKFELIFKKVNTGSTVPHANKNYINNFKIALPSDFSTMQRLENNICLFINNISINKKENQNLAALRDFLLPLLMNGQVGFKENISVKEIEVDNEKVFVSANEK